MLAAMGLSLLLWDDDETAYRYFASTYENVRVHHELFKRNGNGTARIPDGIRALVRALHDSRPTEANRELVALLGPGHDTWVPLDRFLMLAGEVLRELREVLDEVPEGPGADG